jgi:hypothetical protein
MDSLAATLKRILLPLEDVTVKAKYLPEDTAKNLAGDTRSLPIVLVFEKPVFRRPREKNDLTDRALIVYDVPVVQLLQVANGVCRVPSYCSGSSPLSRDE